MRVLMLVQVFCLWIATNRPQIRFGRQPTLDAVRLDGPSRAREGDVGPLTADRRVWCAKALLAPAAGSDFQDTHTPAHDEKEGMKTAQRAATGPSTPLSCPLAPPLLLRLCVCSYSRFLGSCVVSPSFQD